MPTVSVIRVKEALQEVLDPCSVGRGVPAGLVDMGMVKAVEVGSTPDGHAVVAVELRITSPACTFQPYFEREVRPHVPDAWMDRTKDKIGYEINFNRHFYAFNRPRRLQEIDADLKLAEDRFVRLLTEVTA